MVHVGVLRGRHTYVRCSRGVVGQRLAIAVIASSTLAPGTTTSRRCHFYAIQRSVKSAREGRQRDSKLDSLERPAYLAKEFGR